MTDLWLYLDRSLVMYGSVLRDCLWLQVIAGGAKQLAAEALPILDSAGYLLRGTSSYVCHPNPSMYPAFGSIHAAVDRSGRSKLIGLPGLSTGDLN